MKHSMERELKQYLESNSICEKCETQMAFVDIPFERLPPNIQDLLIHFGLNYQVVNCPGCGSNGIHTFQK